MLGCDGCDEPDSSGTELAESPVLLASSDDPVRLLDSPTLPDCAEVEGWLPLDGTPSLEPALRESCDAELGGRLDAVDIDDNSERPDEVSDVGLESLLDGNPLGKLEEVADSLDRSCEDGDWLDGFFDLDDREEAVGDGDDGLLLSNELPDSVEDLLDDCSEG